MNPSFTIETYLSAIFDVLSAQIRSVVLSQRVLFILLAQNPPCDFPILPTIFVKNIKDPYTVVVFF